jgi:hypothetical protein
MLFYHLALPIILFLTFYLKYFVDCYTSFVNQGFYKMRTKLTQRNVRLGVPQNIVDLMR